MRYLNRLFAHSCEVDEIIFLIPIGSYGAGFVGKGCVAISDRQALGLRHRHSSIGHTGLPGHDRIQTTSLLGELRHRLDCFAVDFDSPKIVLQADRNPIRRDARFGNAPRVCRSSHRDTPSSRRTSYRPSDDRRKNHAKAFPPQVHVTKLRSALMVTRGVAMIFMIRFPTLRAELACLRNGVECPQPFCLCAVVTANVSGTAFFVRLIHFRHHLHDDDIANDDGR